jgi:lipoate-protein ligase A
VLWTSAREEQAWNVRVLEQRVDRPRVQLWGYHAPAVVLGCSQRADPAVLQRAHACGIDLVGRRAGGGAVLVGPWMVGVSVALPPDHPLCGTSLVGSYRWLGLVHARALRSVGVEARARPPDKTHPQRRDGPLTWACFGSFSPWEVASRDGRKLVGLAQVRRSSGILLVGGTLVDHPPWALLTDVLSRTAAEADALQARAAACAEYTRGRAGTHDIAAALERELMDTLRLDGGEDADPIGDQACDPAGRRGSYEQ